MRVNSVSDVRNQESRLSIRSNVAWTLAGNACYVVCQYLMLMATAKLCDAQIVGQYTMAIAICTPIIVGSQMQLRQVQATDVRDDYGFGTYMGLRVICTLIGILLVMGVTVLGGYSETMAPLILLMGCAKGFESLSDAAFGKLQRLERMDLIAISLASKGIVSSVVFVALLWVTRQLFWPIAGLALVSGAAYVCYDLRIAVCRGRGCTPPSITSWLTLGSLFLLAVPLGLTTGLQSLSSNLPRYFLEAFHGREAVAAFAVASAPLSLLALFNGAISQATMSRAAYHFQTGNVKAFQRLNWQILAAPVVLGCGFTGIFALWGATLLELLFTREYRNAAPLLVMMSAGLAFGSLTSLGSTILNAARAFRLQLLVIALVVAGQIPLCMYFIPKDAAVGAAYTECIRHFLFVIFLSVAGNYVICKNRSGITLPQIGQPLETLRETPRIGQAASH